MTVTINSLYVRDREEPQGVAERHRQVKELANFARACADVFYPQDEVGIPDLAYDARVSMAADIFARLVVAGVTSDHRQVNVL